MSVQPERESIKSLCGTPEPPPPQPKFVPGPTNWLGSIARDAFYRCLGADSQSKKLNQALDAALIALLESFDRSATITPVTNSDRVGAMSAADVIELVSAHMRANVAGIKTAAAKTDGR